MKRKWCPRCYPHNPFTPISSVCVCLCVCPGGSSHVFLCSPSVMEHGTQRARRHTKHCHHRADERILKRGGGGSAKSTLSPTTSLTSRSVGLSRLRSSLVLKLKIPLSWLVCNVVIISLRQTHESYLPCHQHKCLVEASILCCTADLHGCLCHTVCFGRICIASHISGIRHDVVTCHSIVSE